MFQSPNGFRTPKQKLIDQNEAHLGVLLEQIEEIRIVPHVIQGLVSTTPEKARDIGSLLLHDCDLDLHVGVTRVFRNIDRHSFASAVKELRDRLTASEKWCANYERLSGEGSELQDLRNCTDDEKIEEVLLKAIFKVRDIPSEEQEEYASKHFP